jgi:exopolysaccharide biosynthesis polyprenyl glycosylphosphotransferase
VRRLAVPALLLLPFTVGSPTPWRLCLQAAATTLAVCLARGASYGLIRSLRRRGRLVEPTVIVGVGEVGMQVESLIEEHPEYGLQVVGFVDAMPDGVRLARPLLGEVQDLETVLHRFEVHRVIIAFGYVAEANWVSVLRTAVLKGVEVHVIPRFFDVGMATGGIGVDEIWGIPLWRVRRSALRTTAWRAKRVFDVAVSASALMVLFPVVAVLAAMVRLTSPGPVLFRQTRVGQNGQLFELLKFRSMRVDHDGNSWHAPDDELTRIGGFLRGTSLDELPQFWNVLKGDMSLVGPRPERPIFAERFSADIPGYVDRHRVAVGLTGWAQINGLRGNGTSLPERARFDNVYIEGWSLWFDLVILVRTFGSLVGDAIRWTRRQ